MLARSARTALSTAAVIVSVLFAVTMFSSMRRTTAVLGRGVVRPRNVPRMVSVSPLRSHQNAGLSVSRHSKMNALTGGTLFGVKSAVAASAQKVDSQAKANELLDGIDTIIFDCDGVIWKGDTLIEGIPETLDYLREQGKKVYFVTNNARKSRAGYKKKFDDLGLQISPEEVLSSSFAAAAYLDQVNFKESGKSVYVVGDVGIGEELDLLDIPWSGGPADMDKQIELKSGFALPHDGNVLSSSFAAAAYLDQVNFKESGKSVYVVGDVGIGEELDLLDIPWSGGPADMDKQIELKSGFALPHDGNVGAVICGFDYGINYYKIQYAQLCINENPGCLFIATNLDALTHLTDAQEWAGNGAMVGALKGCTGKEPIVVGKPSPLLIDYLVGKFGLKKERILMVGDRLDTDIVFGNENGLKSCLTLTGVTSESKLLGPDNQIIPDVYVDSINAFRGA
eukprot:jgi/Bigna1/91932/estExt_fgenesh1_pg.C_1310016